MCREATVAVDPVRNRLRGAQRRCKRVARERVDVDGWPFRGDARGIFGDRSQRRVVAWRETAMRQAHSAQIDESRDTATNRRTRREKEKKRNGTQEGGTDECDRREKRDRQTDVDRWSVAKEHEEMYPPEIYVVAGGIGKTE